MVSNDMHSVALRGNQRASHLVASSQMSGALRGTQLTSIVIRGNQRASHLVASSQMSGALRGTQR